MGGACIRVVGLIRFSGFLSAKPVSVNGITKILLFSRSLIACLGDNALRHLFLSRNLLVCRQFSRCGTKKPKSLNETSAPIKLPPIPLPIPRRQISMPASAKRSMKILLVNPPHLSIGSRMAREHLPPLGLLSIGGPLIDAGHEVTLLDADFHNYKVEVVAQKILEQAPDAILLGHSGSTSAQPIINEITRLVRARNAAITIIIGGVFPTYHWSEILETQPQIDYIVCGEGEEISCNLIAALEGGNTLETIKGLALRANGVPLKTVPAENIKNLDDFRVGWELMRDYNYTYWGKRKAVVIQFSRGCPYPCTYCGQSLFWKKWRHRSA